MPNTQPTSSPHAAARGRVSPRRVERSHQGLTIAQAGSGRADPGPDTLWTLARALDGLFAVLAGAP